MIRTRNDGREVEVGPYQIVQLPGESAWSCVGAEGQFCWHGLARCFPTLRNKRKRIQRFWFVISRTQPWEGSFIVDRIHGGGIFHSDARVTIRNLLSPYSVRASYLVRAFDGEPYYYWAVEYLEHE